MSLSAETLLSPHSQDLLKQLCPDGPEKTPRLVYNIWKYMLLCFDTPRPSAREEQIRNRLISVAEILGCEHEVDGVGNLIIRRSPSVGYESRVRLAIQGHLDMVTSKTDDSPHNFDTDPIIARITDDKEWVIANNTTLGADDGIGVAAAMAILEEIDQNNDFKVGPIECLFTTEEETTMRGALEIAQQSTKFPGQRFMRAQALLNLDSEEDERICVGCAGGGEADICIRADDSVRATQALGEEYTLVDLKVFGLVGGHTGTDIHTGRGNAIKLLGQTLKQIAEQFDVKLVSMDGGNAPNAIPRDASAQVIVPKASIDDITNLITNNILPEIRKQIVHAEAGLGADASEQDVLNAINNLTIDISFSPVTSTATEIAYLNNTVRDTILNLMGTIPHGVIAMSSTVEGAVETSNAFSIVRFVSANDPINHGGFDQIQLHSFFRSFVDKELDTVMGMLTDAATKADNGQSIVTISKMLDSFPGWAPNLNTALHPATLRAYAKTFKTDKKPEVYSVHAGLETGPIMGRYPDIVAISIGPLVIDAHSPTEKLNIATVGPFVNWVHATIEELAQIEADDFIVKA